MQITIEQIQKIFNIQNALNKIEVRGSENLGLLYGCINTIQGLLSELQDQSNQEKK